MIRWKKGFTLFSAPLFFYWWEFLWEESTWLRNFGEKVFRTWWTGKNKVGKEEEKRWKEGFSRLCGSLCAVRETDERLKGDVSLLINRIKNWKTSFYYYFAKVLYHKFYQWKQNSFWGGEMLTGDLPMHGCRTLGLNRIFKK